ncbi:DUF2293 domain-containing protein [Rubellicoccus peritrichatus]|uniref:DUF2293 domain-containing protein n=1 Tax=Rubellicoccus peritrichatus TaxID=3080537 RepID=A0AAQ3LA53_9BACT|nr:DUF2293 domain-containing protein [Puniceicoccus sp. CR14]WOO40180.1 DUF2293 domain-containing protein [Puniceicoccus sp. CR14]
MPIESRTVRPCAKPNHVISESGEVLPIPHGWELLKPGDAALSRRIKKATHTWTVKEKKGRKVFSRGIWAPAEDIASIRTELENERADPVYQKKLNAGWKRRSEQQTQYVKDFEQTVFEFLDFHSRYQLLARELAARIAAHATPVGSGTVARTQRIPIEQRAEAATIAWMRHQTTAYDNMAIPRIKGQRREVRRMLAKQSQAVLSQYRSGHRVDVQLCPLQAAIRG